MKEIFVANWFILARRVQSAIDLCEKYSFSRKIFTSKFIDTFKGGRSKGQTEGKPEVGGGRGEGEGEWEGDSGG